MVDIWKERWEVKSTTDASKTYTVARKKKDGAMGCNCPRWTFPSCTCGHISRQHEKTATGERGRCIRCKCDQFEAARIHCKHITALLQAIVVIQRRTRIFLDGNREVDALSIRSFPTAAEVNKIVGKSNFEMQVAVAGEQLQVKRIFLEE